MTATDYHLETSGLEFEAMERELHFLRYFYDAAGEAFGCASDDVYQLIKDDYTDDEGPLPEGIDE